MESERGANDQGQGEEDDEEELEAVARTAEDSEDEDNDVPNVAAEQDDEDNEVLSVTLFFLGEKYVTYIYF